MIVFLRHFTAFLSLGGSAFKEVALETSNTGALESDFLPSRPVYSYPSDLRQPHSVGGGHHQIGFGLPWRSMCGPLPPVLVLVVLR